MVRKLLWADLLPVLPSNLPTILLGDFIVILSPEEKSGGRPFTIQESEDFQDFLQDAKLSDLGFCGSKFTWCNNRSGMARIYKRLDWGLVNQNWLDKNITTTVTHLAKVGSDHSPLLVESKELSQNAKKSFKFLKFWIHQPGFQEVVRAAWDMEYDAPPMQKLLVKLKKVKGALREWSFASVGDIFKNLQMAEQEAVRMEEVARTSNREEDLKNLNTAKANLAAA